MEWKKIVNKPDLKVFEASDGSKVRIEARLEKDKWHIIKKDLDDPSKYVQEFEINVDDFEEFIDEIMHKPSTKKKSINVKLYRVFKDSFVEKWLISVNKEKYSNFVLIHYDDLTTLDFVLHIKYKSFEQMIVKDVVNSLGLNEDDLEYNIYYYSYSNRFFDLKYYDYEDEE